MCCSNQAACRIGAPSSTPRGDYLRDGIYELRAAQGHVNFRILYFFQGRIAAVLSHALTKRDAVPEVEINRCTPPEGFRIGP